MSHDHALAPLKFHGARPAHFSGKPEFTPWKLPECSANGTKLPTIRSLGNKQIELSNSRGKSMTGRIDQCQCSFPLLRVRRAWVVLGRHSARGVGIGKMGRGANHLRLDETNQAIDLRSGK